MVINKMFSNISQNKVYKLVSSHSDHTVFSREQMWWFCDEAMKWFGGWDHIRVILS